MRWILAAWLVSGSTVRPGEWMPDVTQDRQEGLLSRVEVGGR